MEYSKEQLDILREGFREHDITKDASLSGDYTLPPEQAAAYQLLEKLTKGYLDSELPELGIKRSMRNYSGDHPAKRLLDTDAQVIAEHAAEIMTDGEKNCGCRGSVP